MEVLSDDNLALNRNRETSYAIFTCRQTEGPLG